MATEVLIKEPHKEFLDKMVQDHSLSNCQEAISLLVTFASKSDSQSNDDFFDYRCVGSCHENDIPVSMEFSTDAVEYLKRMIDQFDLIEYDTEEEELGKAVRCLINYADEDGDQKSIFTNVSS